MSSSSAVVGVVEGDVVGGHPGSLGELVGNVNAAGGSIMVTSHHMSALGVRPRLDTMTVGVEPVGVWTERFDEQDPAWP